MRPPVAALASGGLTPQWAPNLTFGLQQPLLQGFGTGLNALLPQHPSINAGGAQNYIRSNETQQTGIVMAVPNDKVQGLRTKD